MIARLLCCVAVSAACCGCVHQTVVRPQLAAPGADWLEPLALDIDNFYGSVRVVVDPSADHPQPRAKVGVSWTVDRVLRKEAAASVKVLTRTVREDGGIVLRVRTSSTWVDPEGVWVDLVVVVPNCAGVRVLNRGGPVELVGISGGVQVENAEFAGNPGRIEVRTAAAMTEPVLLVTDRGSVVYQVGANSVGTFDIRSDDGAAEFDAVVVQPDYVRVVNRSHVEARVSGAAGGGNPVMLRTGRGTARAFIIENPATYTNLLR